MDNAKTDSYYIEKIRKDLEFIVDHMQNVDIEELNANNLLGNYHLDSLVDPRTNKLYSESLSARLLRFEVITAERAYFISDTSVELAPNNK